AQMGSFIPAEKASLGVVDRIFTRIGARDELARGRSTFMVEMVETADILHNVTDRSLVVLDEIGRGTSTYDGMSIAWAVLEYLIQAVKRPKVLFATHFHELTQLADRYPEVTNWSMAVEEGGGGIVFLHQVVPRPADRSYGIEVARLAGLPQAVVARAQELLDLFEGENSFSLVSEPVAETGQLALFTVAADALIDEIAAIDPDKMTPLQALEKLYELRQRCREVRTAR
ncbi:MAG: DNA mismatch repair protein MutS, partial [Synergistales bacterium]|nr:DNA mismatch repair protein MutS [Synergistales bacterium]